ncbi:hypothetical protein [Brachymonas wangyanguii]|uniref:hypothetical protein n=1 Tax=Brachymonas wangyanguii TaxID=3130163 RepID=UPI00307D073A
MQLRTASVKQRAAQILICTAIGQRVAPTFNKELAMGRGDKEELRWMAERFTVDMLDAVSAARGIARTSLADKVLFDWAVQQAREANAIQRVTRGNPPPADVIGRGTDQFGD